MSNDVINYEKYIPMDKYDYKWCFYFEGKRIPDVAIDKIKPLSQKYSAMLWEKYISRKNRHLMLLDKNECPFLLSRQDYNWQNDWNENDYEGLGNYLADKVRFQDDEIIVFFWMKEWAVETTWETFRQYWINFLFEDEGPVLISTQRRDTIVFGPMGELFIGSRTTE